MNLKNCRQEGFSMACSTIARKKQRGTTLQRIHSRIGGHSEGLTTFILTLGANSVADSENSQIRKNTVNLTHGHSVRLAGNRPFFCVLRRRLLNSRRNTSKPLLFRSTAR